MSLGALAVSFSNREHDGSRLPVPYPGDGICQVRDLRWQAEQVPQDLELCPGGTRRETGYGVGSSELSDRVDWLRISAQRDEGTGGARAFRMMRCGRDCARRNR